MRHPIVQQHDSNDCGPACLAMVAAWYGKRQSIGRIREIAGTDRQGTNLAGLARAAEKIGFRARGVRATREGLDEIELPAIAHWSEEGRNHFVVVFDRTRRGFRVGDPALGRRRLTPDEFHARWTGVLLLLAPTPELKNSQPASAGLLWSLLRQHRKLFADALLAAVLVTLLGLSNSFFIQALFDFVFVIGREPALNWLGLGMLLALAARTAFLWLRACLLAHLSHRVDADIVLGYHDHLLGLPLSFFAARRTGEILSRLGDAARLRLAISSSGLALIVDAATLVLTSAVMFWIDWRLAALALSAMPVLLTVIWALTGPMKREQRRAMERAADFEAHAVESVSSIETVKAYGAERAFRLRGEARFQEVIDAAFTAQMFGVHSAAAGVALAGGAGLVMLWAGAHQVLDGSLTPGRLMALYTMLGTVTGPVERLAGANQIIQDALVATERLREVFAVKPESVRERASRIDRPIEGAIELRGVTFRYGSRRPIVENASLRIDRGECVRIAGASGTGKSTLARLLARLEMPEEGCLLIDGIDAADYGIDCLRRQVVYVSQQADLFSMSITGNIRIGRPDAPPEAVLRAARTTRVDEFAGRLPLGYDTVVGERALTLSGGERQRLALARAVLADPPVLILDEPSNHLDAESCCVVHRMLEDRRRRNLTTVVISHEAPKVDRTIRIDRHVYAVAT